MPLTVEQVETTISDRQSLPARTEGGAPGGQRFQSEDFLAEVHRGMMGEAFSGWQPFS